MNHESIGDLDCSSVLFFWGGLFVRWQIWQVWNSWVCVCQQASSRYHFYPGKCTFDIRKSNQETGSLIYTNKVYKCCYWNAFLMYSLFRIKWCWWWWNTKIIHCQLLLFAMSNDSEKILPTFQEAAKLFKGKVKNRVWLYICHWLNISCHAMLCRFFTKDSSNHSICIINR